MQLDFVEPIFMSLFFVDACYNNNKEIYLSIRLNLISGQKHKETLSNVIFYITYNSYIFFNNLESTSHLSA